MLRILHLSDLHFRKSDPDDRDRALRALLGTLGDWQKAGRPPEVVLISGDLVEHGDPAAYATVGRFLDRLRAACGGLPAARIFVVPGNQDVQRAAGRRLQRILLTAEDAAAFFGAPEERTLHNKKLAAYTAFVDTYFGPGRAARTTHLLDLAGLTVGIGTFCTAWFSQDGDDSDRECLFVGESVLLHAERELAAADLSIAVCHHPPDWLHPIERAAVTAILGQSFHLLCHGHLRTQRPTEWQGTPLSATLVLAAGASHRSATTPSRVFVIDIDPAERTALISPLCFTTGASRWEADRTLADLYGTSTAPRALPLPTRAADRKKPADDAAAHEKDCQRRYLTWLSAQVDEALSVFTHPNQGTALRLEPLYVELPASVGGHVVPVHGLPAAHERLLLLGEAGAGKTATVRRLCGLLARLALGLPSEAEGYGFAKGHAPVPLYLSLDQTPGAGHVDLASLLLANIASLCGGLDTGFAQNLLFAGSGTLLCVDGLSRVPRARQETLLQELMDLLREIPRLRVLLTLSPKCGLVPPAEAGFTTATLFPLRPAESTLLVDRWVQQVSTIPEGMTLDGAAAELTTLMRRAITSDHYTALVRHPLLLTSMCWVSGKQGLPRQRAELYATCLGALVQNKVRPTPQEVGDLVDELAERSEPLQSFRIAQTLNGRVDLWQAVRSLLDDPMSYDALRFLSGLQARRSPEHGARLLRSMSSEVGGRSEVGQRAQLIGLGAQMLDEMAPCPVDPKAAKKIKDDLQRVLDDLSDRVQRTALSTRIAMAEGLGMAGDPRLSLDILDPTPRPPGLFVDLPAGRGMPACGMMRYPLTCAQLWHLVRTSGYRPPQDEEHDGRVDILSLWEQRARERPTHPATMLSWDDALGLCRFLTAGDWRYRYDLPTESEWERAVRQGSDDNRQYPWGATAEPSYCNTGRRVGHTTPVGVFPAGTANAGAGCADLIGNVWEWAQNEYDDDPTMTDTDEGGHADLSGMMLPGGKVVRGGSWNYLRAGVMRSMMPGHRSEEIGVRLVRRSRYQAPGTGDIG